MAFCNLCKREVGVEKQRPWLSTVLFIILGLIIPLWPITLPLFWGIGVLNFVLRSKKTCGVCKSKGLSSRAPVERAAA